MKTAKEPIPMNNNRKKWLLLLLSLALAMPTTYAYADDEPNQSDPNQMQYNPFAKLQFAGIKPPQQQQQKMQQRQDAITYDEPTEKPPLFIETIVVKFLDAQNLKPVVESMLSPFGSIAVDKASNSIILCDAEEPLRRMVGEIRKIDKTPQLLQIEVVIIDVGLGDDTEIGVNWDMLSTNDNTAAFRQNYTNRLAAVPPTTETIGSATAYNSLGQGSDLSIISGSVRNVVHMLQEKRKVEILASPTVLVVSGKSASVETVEEIPYQDKTDSSLGGGFTSTQFKLVGVKLNVTATLTDDNDILLAVEPEQNTNTGEFGINNIPIIDTRKAKTNLLLRDSEVVIMGGLRRKESSKVREQIPILGDIPLLGLLFGKDKIKTANSELVVFISPHIYRGQPISPEKLAKLNYARNLKDIPMIDPNDMKILKRP
jgi:type II secretory pathway component GspD/PulD (secretin)